MLARLRLIPQDERFFDLFNRSAANTLEGARILYELMTNFVDVERKARHLKDIEHTGDEMTHEVFGALNRTFVTPIDRFMIHLIVVRQKAAVAASDARRPLNIVEFVARFTGESTVVEVADLDLLRTAAHRLSDGLRLDRLVAVVRMQGNEQLADLMAVWIICFGGFDPVDR